MPPAFRLMDKAQVAADAHGCPACPHPGIGPAIIGSPTVNINKLPAVRMQDKGMHAACCGMNMWECIQGSATVFINNKPAVRLGDATAHCQVSQGQTVEGSPDVL